MPGAGSGGEAGERHEEIEIGAPHRAACSRGDERRMHPLAFHDRQTGDLRLGFVRRGVGRAGARQPDGIALAYDQPRCRFTHERGQAAAWWNDAHRLQSGFLAHAKPAHAGSA